MFLPNTSGSDKSWGFGLNLFDGKLVVRVSRFDDLQRNAQTGDINTLAGRVLRMDFLAAGQGNPTPFINLYDNATRWVTNANPTWTADQVAAEVQKGRPSSAWMTKITTALRAPPRSQSAPPRICAPSVLSWKSTITRPNSGLFFGFGYGHAGDQSKYLQGPG